MIDESEIQPSEWEVRRGGEPIKFNQILMWQLKKVLETPIGDKPRNRALRDLQSLLAHFIWRDKDRQFEKDLKEADELGKRVSKNEETGIEPDEAVEIKQSEWLSAIMRLMKRFDLLGDEHISG